MLEYISREDRQPSRSAGKNLKSEVAKRSPVDALPITENAMTPYLSRLKVKLLETGYRDGQIRRLLQTAAGLGRYLEWRKISLGDAGTAELEAYSTYCGRSPSGRRTDYNTGLSTIQFVLRPYGILCRKEPPSYASTWLEQFEAHLRTVRGLKEITYAAYRRFLTPFILGLCHDGPPQWQELNGPYISAFVTAELKKAASGRRTVIAGIRNFLRYLISQGLVARGFLRAIPRVRSWRYSNLPHPLTAEEHEMVLKACQTPESGSLRDRAFVATLALLGLRGGELRQLRLDDIEWKEGVIHIRHGKGDRERTLPLPKEAGALIADYIMRERPQSVHREVFLTVLSPRAPFSGGTACYLVRQYLQRLGLRGPRLGSHCFRHTAATLMVRNGATIKEVADVLGHKSIATTQIYVKLDEPALQSVALPWVGGEL